jgi:hypothetical protein
MLKIGTQRNGSRFELPHAALVQTFAILAIRGAGKTCAATVIAEEMYKASLPWICLDPVGVWWGLRASPDGEGKGIPVVIFGGQHADLPLTGGGKKIADALMSEPICAVLDVSQESKRFWHTFLTDFCLRLMELNPDVPRHIFIEEAPEFVPQRTRVDLTARCKEAVERLVRLGRNRGYGCTLISQRPATVDKDVLSQCENIFAMRTVGPHDRSALKEWMEGKQLDALNKGAAEHFLNELPSLSNGTAYFWSPHWLKILTRVTFRRRETFHPGETREIGKAVQSVRLADVGGFVERLKPALMAIEQPKSKRRTDNVWEPSPKPVHMPDNPETLRRVAELEQRLSEESRLRHQADQKIEKLRQFLKPQYDALSSLFSEIGQAGGNSHDMIDRSVYEPWLQKASRTGCRRLLETLLDRPQLTKAQLSTLSGTPQNSTFRAYVAWLKRNGLVDVEGDMVKLRMV